MSRGTLRILKPLNELIPKQLKRYRVEVRRNKTQLQPTRVIRFGTKEEADSFMSKSTNNTRLIIGY